MVREYKHIFYYVSAMKYVDGEIFSPDGFTKGYLGFDKNNIIVEVGKGKAPEKPVATGLIVPTFVNAHTHIGDSFIKKKKIDLPKTVEELVAPPNGLKHQLLRETAEDEILEGMEESIHLMAEGGTSHFCDFRENGFRGIQQLKHALKGKNIFPVILSRPNLLEYDAEEINLLLENSDGIGLSSISDWDYSNVQKVADNVHQKDKIFAFHGSEVVRENIDQILDLQPDFLVHMTKATESDLARVKEQNIPVVVCPRSNAFYGLTPNVRLLKKVGIDIMLGTDNAMLTSPDILSELWYVKNHFREFSHEELLSMITYTPRKALNLDCGILGPNLPAHFIVLGKKSLKPLYTAACHSDG